MNKTAEQAAREFVTKKYGKYGDPRTEMGFIAGAAWQAAQSQWIKINSEKDLPEKQCHCLVIAPKSFPKNCIMVVAEFYDDNNIFYSESSDYPMEDVTHWKPLPEAPSNL